MGKIENIYLKGAEIKTHLLEDEIKDDLVTSPPRGVPNCSGRYALAHDRVLFALAEAVIQLQAKVEKLMEEKNESRQKVFRKTKNGNQD